MDFLDETGFFPSKDLERTKRINMDACHCQTVIFFFFFNSSFR